jgi:CBS domain-containing protein
MGAMKVADIMTREVRTVPPDMRISDLERRLLKDRVGGFPVVEDGRLVGQVSRSDIVRMLVVERSVAEDNSGFYLDVSGAEPPSQSLAQIGETVGRRIDKMTVSDAMIRDVVSVTPDTDLSEAADQMLSRHFHRLPVVEGGALVGLLTTMDFVRIAAKGDR